MNLRVQRTIIVILSLTSLIFGLTGCNLPLSPAASGAATSAPAAATSPAVAPTDTSMPPTGTPVPIVHTLKPGQPGGALSSIKDADTAPVAAQHRTNAGENFSANLFERPFDQSMNTYYPDLDLKSASLSRDDSWDYVVLNVGGPDPKGGLLGVYGVEIDVNMDGRGDFLVMGTNPGADWSTDGVHVWKDANHDVGGGHPIQADQPPQTGDGYETILFDQGQGTDPDMAWIRISPSNVNQVQLAFKRSFFADPDKYLWGGWAVDPGMFHPEWYDYDDHFSHAEAGSPLPELTQYYPLKALFAIDNTCRWSVGFTPTTDLPGICPLPPTPTPKPSITPSPTKPRLIGVPAKVKMTDTPIP